MSRLDDLLPKNSASREVGDLPLAGVIERYLEYYASGSSHTARAKRADLKAFERFLLRGQPRGAPGKKPHVVRVRVWDHSSVQRFVDERLSRGEAPATVARRLATIKHMGRVLAEKVAGFVNPAREVKSPKFSPTEPQGLSRAELSRLRAFALARIAERGSFSRRRNYALVMTLIETGLRADEVRLLRMQQLDPKCEWFTGVRTKGRRFRNVYITSYLRPLLRQYCEARDAHLKRRFPTLSSSCRRAMPLFVSTYNAGADDPESFLMGAKSVWRAVRETSGELKLHPHRLRHAFALELLEASGDIRLVAQALGHSDVRVTMRYTERRDADVARALERSRKRRSSSKR